MRRYKKYKLAAEKTVEFMLISCGTRLTSFDIRELKDYLMKEDELELDTLGNRKRHFCYYRYYR